MPYISCGPACFHITATLGIWVPRNNDEKTMLMRNPARLYLGRKKELRGQDLHTTWPQGSLDLSKCEALCVSLGIRKKWGLKVGDRDYQTSSFHLMSNNHEQ